jgi:hypothetical protein
LAYRLTMAVYCRRLTNSLSISRRTTYEDMVPVRLRALC